LNFVIEGSRLRQFSETLQRCLTSTLEIFKLALGGDFKGMKKAGVHLYIFKRFLWVSLVDVFMPGWQGLAELSFLDANSLIVTFVLVESVTSP
jgi:hypothetical protein